MIDRPKTCTVAEFVDDRGRLRVFENGASLGFTPVRCFVICDVPEGGTRGGHAVSCDEFVVVLQGSCRAVVVGADGRCEFALDDRADGLHVPRDTWFRLEHFAAGTIVAVFASKEFGEATYIREPPPG